MPEITRKARTWHATAKVPAIPAYMGDVTKLPVLPASKVYADPIRALPLTDFSADTPERFIMERGHGRRFVIDTAGYSYARYAAELVG
jgi:hypothetical protein